MHAEYGRHVRVLLVDDSRDEREMYAECFRQEGFCTIQAENALDAYRLASELQPQVVVTGVKLSGQADGFALARQLKADERTRTMPVVVLSGYASERHRDAAARSGCDLFLLKPCLPMELFENVTDLVSRAARQPAAH
jgi:DNA-binding response OmpR family regulator